MTCPKCGSEQLHVVDSRPRPGYRYRRIECLACSKRFSTIELPEKVLDEALGGHVYLTELLEELDK